LDRLPRQAVYRIGIFGLLQSCASFRGPSFVDMWNAGGRVCEHAAAVGTVTIGGETKSRASITVLSRPSLSHVVADHLIQPLPSTPEPNGLLNGLFSSPQILSLIRPCYLPFPTIQHPASFNKIDLTHKAWVPQIWKSVLWYSLTNLSV